MRVQAASARWIAGALVLTSAAWLVALAGLLALANRVHDDVPLLLAVKLPLLQARPELIFAGESRTLYQVDANLAAQLIGRPQGAVVNIAYDAGEPLALLAAMRRQPDRFQKARVVVSVVPFLFNEGVRSAAVYPQDVAARLGVAEQMRSFLPLRVGTLIRFIREAFNARLAADQRLAELAPCRRLSVRRSSTTLNPGIDGPPRSARTRITPTGTCRVRRRDTKSAHYARWWRWHAGSPSWCRHGRRATTAPAIRRGGRRTINMSR